MQNLNDSQQKLCPTHTRELWLCFKCCSPSKTRVASLDCDILVELGSDCMSLPVSIFPWFRIIVRMPVIVAPTSTSGRSGLFDFFPNRRNLSVPYRGGDGESFWGLFDVVNKVRNAGTHAMIILMQDSNCVQNVADVSSATPWTLAITPLTMPIAIITMLKQSTIPTPSFCLTLKWVFVRRSIGIEITLLQC